MLSGPQSKVQNMNNHHSIYCCDVIMFISVSMSIGPSRLLKLWFVYVCACACACVCVCVSARAWSLLCCLFKKKVIHLERALTRTLNSKLRNVKSMWPVTHTHTKKQPTWRKEAAMTCTRAVTHYRTSTTDTQWVISKYCFSFEFRRCH